MGGRGVLGPPVEPLMVLGDLWEPKQICLQRLKAICENGRVRVESRHESDKKCRKGSWVVQDSWEGLGEAQKQHNNTKDLKKVQVRRGCLARKRNSVTQETHGREPRGSGGHLCHVARW